MQEMVKKVKNSEGKCNKCGATFRIGTKMRTQHEESFAGKGSEESARQGSKFWGKGEECRFRRDFRNELWKKSDTRRFPLT